ncbi:MAG: DNA-3-methyladenine glycosylase 2 family protein [Bacteroidetes bacterium HGW-Bacteroidetes-7]|jgi:3-methyladenine DNA glycosylase/8-oxoguanine DNA glycosylase|nr:MAG: DNA-3-methyladenine glycosylase 2 family protein [Bacteroidetes bacterium HGW-Bacteroidetes-7]
MKYIQYGDKELSYLKSRCPRLSELIEQLGFLKREVIPDPFVAIVASVASQQISGRAAETIWKRFTSVVGEVNPSNILNLDSDVIRACGLSARKTEYITGIAKRANSGEVDFSKLSYLTDKEVVEELVKLKGVGEWTAEMILIFSLQRPNILSYGDFAIKKGLAKLHGKDAITKEEFDFYKELYSPYCSIASLYIWEV